MDPKPLHRATCRVLVGAALASPFVLPGCYHRVPGFQVAGYGYLAPRLVERSVLVLDLDGLESAVTRKRGASYPTGKAALANLEASLSAAFTSVTFTRDVKAMKPGTTYDYFLDVRLKDAHIAANEEDRGMNWLTAHVTLEAELFDRNLRSLGTRTDEGVSTVHYVMGDAGGPVQLSLDAATIKANRALLDGLFDLLGDRRPAPITLDAPVADRIAVLPFAATPPLEALADVLFGSLVLAAPAGTSLVPEAEVAGLLDTTTGAALQGCARPDCGAEAARQLGSRVAVVGKLELTPDDSAAILTLQRVNGTSGAIEATQELRLAKTKDDQWENPTLREGIREAAKLLFAAPPPAPPTGPVP